MTEGFGRLTVETVSARSRVGKPTIYRYWANASEIAMAALMADGASDDPEMDRLLCSALQAQLRSLLAVLCHHARSAGCIDSRRRRPGKRDGKGFPQ